MRAPVQISHTSWKHHGVIHLALVGLFQVVALSFPSGCAVPPNGAKVKESKNETVPATPAVGPADKEEARPHKQETLAAVEDFLSRTKEYRLPAKGEPASVPVAAVPTANATPVQPPVQPPAPAPVPRDAAYANAQISVGDTAPPMTPQAVPALESVSIRSSQSGVGAPANSQKPKITNGPLELQSGEKDDSIELVISSLKKELANKGDVATEWKLRMLLLSLGREVEAASVAENAPPELKGVLPALGEASAAVRNLLRNPTQGSDTAIERVDQLRGLLAAQSEPHVKRVALCRKVLTFGSYEEMASDEFVSGRSIQTIVYAEIENLRVSAEAGGTFETKLSTRLEVMTADGKSMWQREEPEVIDRCRRPRRDFFVAQRVTLPPTLPAGDYVLKFSVEDKTSAMIAESSAPFVIVSPISVAKGQ